LKDNKKVTKNEDRELKAKMEKELSPTRAILRIVIGIIPNYYLACYWSQYYNSLLIAIQQTMGFTLYFVEIQFIF